MKNLKLIALILLIVPFTMTFAEKNVETEPYYMSKVVEGSMDEVQEKTIMALKTVGFGLINEINMHEKLNEKLDTNLKPYRLLGVCNPGYAHKAMQAEENIGLLLPCKIILKEKETGKIEVVFSDPAVLMGYLDNKELTFVADEVSLKLKQAFAALK